MKAVLSNKLYLLLIIFSLFLFPLLYFFYYDPQSALWCDEFHAHIPQINYFINHPLNIIHFKVYIPNFPGYHLFIAYLSILFHIKVVYLNTWVIKIINSLFAYGILIILWNLIRNFCHDDWKTFCLCLPIACSYYILGSATWLSTDNGALFFFVSILYLLEVHPIKWLIALCTFLMVFWRQLFLPVIGVFWLPLLFSKNRKQTLLVAILASAPVLILAGIYFLSWGGLTPPTPWIRHHHILIFMSRVNLIQLLALVGILGLPYIFLFCSDRAIQYSKKQLFMIIVASLISALVLWMITPSTYLDTKDGGLGVRYGSIVWQLSTFFPYFNLGDKSLLVLLFSLPGAFILILMTLRAIRLNYYPTELVMFFLYITAYACQTFPFQRYVEPILLITMSVHGARMVTKTSWQFYVPIVYLLYPMGMLILGGWGIVGIVHKSSMCVL